MIDGVLAVCCKQTVEGQNGVVRVRVACLPGVLAVDVKETCAMYQAPCCDAVLLCRTQQPNAVAVDLHPLQHVASVECVCFGP